MTPIELMRALIAMGEAIKRRRTRVTGRRAMRFYQMVKSTWLVRGEGDNRHTRRVKGWKGEHREVIKAMRSMRDEP